jgi:hypothetical protein
MILSQDFLKAVFLAFVVIAAVTIAPLDEYIFKYARSWRTRHGRRSS